MSFAVFCWLVILLIFIAILIAHIIILSKLTDFGSNHVNPIDLCTGLEKYVNPIFILHVAAMVFLLGDLKRSWIILIINTLEVLFMIKKKKSGVKFFEPITIVRDLNKVEYLHVTALVISVLILIYGLMASIFAAFA